MPTNPWAMRSPLVSNAKEAKAATASLRSAIDLISNPRNLDCAVDEVFAILVGAVCRRSSKATTPESESVTAVVGFGGVLTGACVLHCGGAAARAIAARMTGLDFTAVDDTVKDAIGEICNVLAGAWKGKLPELAAHCDLSVPAIIAGRDYNLRVQAPEFTLQHSYIFDDIPFDVTILCDGLQ